ncbi:MAG: pyrimidine reductase family protein [Actinomycetota bacterium]
MRALLPTPADDVDVHDVYAADWLDRSALRVNFVSSVDGAVSVTGLSRGLQTAGDNRIFAALRDLADVVLVGAGTARAEGYAGIHLSLRRQQIRHRYGFGPTLPTAIVSRSLRLDPGADLFTDTERGARTIVLTCTSSDPRVRAALAARADVVDCGEDEVDLGIARAALVERGLNRILCEGGPTLFANLLAANSVDELCLSVTPLLVGPGSPRITAGMPSASDPAGLRLVGLFTEEDALFCRYAVARSGLAPPFQEQ